MLDIVSTRMLGQYGFLAKVRVGACQTYHCCRWMSSGFHTFTCIQQVFSIFEDLGISVDVVATSEVSVSLTLDPSKLWSRELIQQASVRHFYIFDPFVEELKSPWWAYVDKCLLDKVLFAIFFFAHQPRRKSDCMACFVV